MWFYILKHATSYFIMQIHRKYCCLRNFKVNSPLSYKRNIHHRWTSQPANPTYRNRPLTINPYLTLNYDHHYHHSKPHKMQKKNRHTMSSMWKRNYLPVRRGWSELACFRSRDSADGDIVETVNWLWRKTMFYMNAKNKHNDEKNIYLKAFPL